MEENAHNNAEQSSQTEEFVTLLLTNQHKINSFILSMLPNWVDAEDIMQEVSIVLWRKFDQYQKDTSFVAWGISVARYEVMNYRKKQKRAGILLLNEELLEIISDRIQERKQTKQNNGNLELLHSCLGKLNDKDRQLISMRYNDRKTIKEVGKLTGRAEHGIYKTMARIHFLLTNCMKRLYSKEGTL